MKRIPPLVRAGVWHHRGAYGLVMLAVALTALVFGGALIVGDSVRASLAEQATRGFAGVQSHWMAMGQPWVTATSIQKLPDATVAIQLPGTLTQPERNFTRRVTVYAFDEPTAARWQLVLPERGIVLGSSLGIGDLLKTEETVRLAVPKYNTQPRTGLLGKKETDENTSTITLPVTGILPPDHPLNALQLTPGHAAPVNVFVRLKLLQDRLVAGPRGNLVLGFGERPSESTIRQAMRLEDFGIVLRPAANQEYISIETDRSLVSPSLEQWILQNTTTRGWTADPTLVYLANTIAAEGVNATIPYSIVAGVNPTAPAPLGPYGSFTDEEIYLTDWPDSPLKGLAPGSTVRLQFFSPETESGYREQTVAFRLAGPMPTAGITPDPDLTPPFPGITDKLRIGDWNPPFPFDNNRIRRGDIHEKYWEQRKTTPKAFITKRRAEQLFGSTFGKTSSVRVAVPEGQTAEMFRAELRSTLESNLNPMALGFQLSDLNTLAATASRGNNDFAGLFLGFSLFLLISAGLFLWVTVRFFLERRAGQLGLLASLGYSTAEQRRILLLEAAVPTFLGLVLGLSLALVYSRGMLELFQSLWPVATVERFRVVVSPMAVVMTTVVILVITLWTVRGAVNSLLREPVPGLLRGRVAGGATLSRRGLWLGWPILAVLLGMGISASGLFTTNPDAKAGSFFGGGLLILTAGVLIVRRKLARPGVNDLRSGWANARRFATRNLFAIIFISLAIFLIVAVDCFRRTTTGTFDTNSGGSGGYRLVATSDQPIYTPLESATGQAEMLANALALRERNPGAGGPAVDRVIVENKRRTLQNIRSFRIRSGDDASCLSLYKPGQPTVVGVPASVVAEPRFAFASTLRSTQNPWELLVPEAGDKPIPVIVEQNTAMWVLKIGVGDSFTINDANGTARSAILVATLQDSVFQSQYLIHESAFRELYPADEGYRLFLVECQNSEETAAEFLTAAYQAQGMTVEPSRDIVARYQAVIGAYLTTFQLLGGLGVVIGLGGILMILLRNFHDRRQEVALYQVLGFSTGVVFRWFFREQLLVLGSAMLIGVIAALVAVAPHAGQGGTIQPQRIAAFLALIGFCCACVIAYSVRRGTRLNIIQTLRTE
ncbi:MAG: FtsX-like permease family protein [Gemmataceae bacterium]